MRGLGRRLLVTAFCAAAVVGTRAAAPLAWAQEPKSKNDAVEGKDKPTKKTEGQDAVAQAALASQLAMEGERRRSPILMLAAAEILGGLKESGKPAGELKRQREGQQGKSDKSPISLTVGDLIDKAKDFAKDDKDLRSLVESRAEQITSRGLIEPLGRNKPGVNIGPNTFKIMYNDVLGAGAKDTCTGMVFEAGRPAIVGVVGDGDGDLDLYVFDAESNQLIGKDEDDTSVCRVAWFPSFQQKVVVVIRNAGRRAERYNVLANW